MKAPQFKDKETETGLERRHLSGVWSCDDVNKPTSCSSQVNPNLQLLDAAMTVL